LKPKKDKGKKSEESPEEGQGEQGQSDQEFVSFALRQPKTGPYEHLLSEFLAQAVITTDRLKKNKVVCEACLFVPEPKREELAIDYERIKVLDDVTTAFLTASSRRNQQLGIDVISIPWPFSIQENTFNKYIAPWFNGEIRFWSDLLSKHVENWRIWKCSECGFEFGRGRIGIDKRPVLPNRCPKCDDLVVSRDGMDYSVKYRYRVIVREPFWSFFFEMSQILSPEGYGLLKNNFTSWANPQVQQTLFRLTAAVDPSLYSAILGIYNNRARKDYSEKVNEKADQITKTEGANGE
jgi:hypothetical protein